MDDPQADELKNEAGRQARLAQLGLVGAVGALLAGLATGHVAEGSLLAALGASTACIIALDAYRLLLAVIEPDRRSEHDELPDP